MKRKISVGDFLTLNAQAIADVVWSSLPEENKSLIIQCMKQMFEEKNNVEVTEDVEDYYSYEVDEI